jgi:exodeoxyribonuclease X
MSHLVRPDRPISPQAMAIHRITEEMVADKPWIEEMPALHRQWYVAHNASFDRRVLPEMHGEWICTMKLARRLWPGIKYSNMGLYKSRKLSVATCGAASTPRAVLLYHRRTASRYYQRFRLAT